MTMTDEVMADLEAKTGLSREQIESRYKASLRTLENCACVGCALFRLSARLSPACFRGEKTEAEIMQEAAAVSGLSIEDLAALSTEGQAAYATCACDLCEWQRLAFQIDRDLYKRALDDPERLEYGQRAVNAVSVRRARRPVQ